MSDLLWFRAFNRPSAVDVVAVLRNGDTPRSDPSCATRRHEIDLGIAPPCVYVYLGMTLEEFGKSAIVLDFQSFDGNVSPFDTGGLVNRIQPVCTWESNARRAFLDQYSWQHDDLPQLLRAYPGDDPDSVAEYLDGTRPRFEGFHELHSGLSSVPIWALNDDRRAWVWEGRRPTRLLVDDALVAWTCPAEQYAQVLRLATRAPKSEHEWFRRLATLYVRGGVTELLGQMRIRQRVA